MKKFVVMSGGFHPFHAGHADLYQQAKEAFPDARVLVCATNAQEERPFPFALKKKLAQLSGVPSKDFIQVSRQFSAQDPALAKLIGDQNNAIVIYVRSDKDRNEQPIPWKLGPDGKPPIGKKGKPLSNYLLEYPGEGQPLYPVSEHAYMDYLRTVEFGPGITSAGQIREKWPTLNDKRKTAMVMSLYPATQKNPQLAQNVVGMFDQVMGEQQGVAEGSLNEFVPPSSDKDDGGNSRSRRIRKLLEIAIQVAKEKNIDELGMIHGMNMVAGDEFFNTAVEGILSDITDKEYMFVLQSAYKTVKQGLAEAKKKRKKKSRNRSLGRYFFPGYSYYGGGGESGESGGDGGGEGMAEGLGIPYPTTYEQENNKFKRRGPMRITAMTEFVTPSGNDRKPDEEEILRQLAAQWWNGSIQQMKKAQQTLQAMGWDIGQDESGDDDAGVFVIRIGDENGDSYIAFSHSELGLNEDYLNEK